VAELGVDAGHDHVHVGHAPVGDPGFRAVQHPLVALRTRAVLEGDERVLNGTKTWITNGGVADVYVVVAGVDPELGHRGQASFLVHTDDPGISPGKKERKLGVRASDTSEVVLDGCRIPADRVLGGMDKLAARLERARSGHAAGQSSAALQTFERTRPNVGIQAVGLARAAAELATTYATQRETFGKPIVEHQAIGHFLADMHTEVDAARLLVHRANWMAATGRTFTRGEGSMSKLKAGETAVWVTEKAVQILGGAGFVKEFPAERWYRDAKIYPIFEGTSEIQRNVIARALSEGP
jgi:alkylation response protein AidB-like acyl-CoA dehydrogenase